jgi:ribonuclease VapC
MIVIDTSALITIFRMEPEADAFLKAIVAAECRFMSAMSVLEASIIMTGRGEANKASPELFASLDDFLVEANIDIVPFNNQQAMLARTAFLRYGKGRHKAALNMGDCVSYALASAREAPLLFKGNDFSHTDIQPAVRTASV